MKIPLPWDLSGLALTNLDISDYALCLAREHDLVDKFPTVAILRVGNQLYIGKNSQEENPFQAQWPYKALRRHAEADALQSYIRVAQKTSGFLEALKAPSVEVYVARAKKDGSPGLAKPCLGCASMLLSFGILPDKWKWTVG